MGTFTLKKANEVVDNAWNCTYNTLKNDHQLYLMNYLSKICNCVLVFMKLDF